MGYPQGYTPSPNRIPGGNFFPNQMQIIHPQQYPAQNFNQNIMGKYPISAPTNQPYPPTNVSNTSLSNTSSNPTEKKIAFNKDSKVFIPKALRTTSQETDVSKTEKSQEADNKIEKTEEHTPKVENEEKSESNVDTRENLTQNHVSETDMKQAEKKETNEVTEKQPEANVDQIKEEPKKVERKSKLSDLLESNKPASGPKNINVNKKVVATIQTDAQKSDIQKAFDEKRKLLINQKKQEYHRPSITTIKKGIILII